MSDTGHIPELLEMANRLAIQDVLTKHSRGVDRADGGLLKSAYWSEAEVAYGSFNGSAHEFCDMLVKVIHRHVATQHRVTNVAIDFNGDDAVVESYVTAYHYTAATESEDHDRELTYLGRYIDHMQRRGEHWKIMFRRVVMDWNQNLIASANFDDAVSAGLARGARAPDDPLYSMQKEIIGESV